MTELAIGINIIMVLGLVLFFICAPKLLGPVPIHEGDKDMPYETGMPPIESASGRMAVLYYRFAVLFVVFDVDLAFLLPWAFNRHALDLGAMISMTVFVGLMAMMLAYLWRRGALECR